jgi:uncharacterized phiE125 gp8 family phage protein
MYDTSLKPILITPPAQVLITLEQARKYCRIDHSLEDDLLVTLIAAATAWLDGYAGMLGRALINQTWRLNMCSWPECKVRLQLAPVSEIVAIRYFDTNNVEQTLAEVNYSLHEDVLSPFVQWSAGALLPGVLDRPDAITVEFVAGYGADASAVPPAIVDAAQRLVAHMYDMRQAIIVGTAQELPLGVSAMLRPFQRINV